tara:strand:- start:48462 stop:48821 length:360 start_codon:yes stop_codon:yes gene_type:complete
MSYLEVGNKTFVIDFDKIENILVLDKDYSGKVTTSSEISEDFDKGGNLIGKTVKTYITPHNKEYDSSKYDILRLMFEVLLTDDRVYDDTLGFDRAMQESPISTKISFNTLIGYGILKEM